MASEPTEVLNALVVAGKGVTKAETGSPPAVKKANRKLLAPRTTNGSRGTIILRKSLRALAFAQELAAAIIVSVQDPCCIISAKSCI